MAHQNSSSLMPFQAKTGSAGLSDGGGGVILRREDVAGLDQRMRGAEGGQRLDQHGGLDRHVERADDAGTLERLTGAIFLAQRHQAGHLVLGHADFLTAPPGQG